MKPHRLPAYRPCQSCRQPVLYASEIPFDVHRPLDARQGEVSWVVLNDDNATFRAVPVSGATVGYRRHQCTHAGDTINAP